MNCPNCRRPIQAGEGTCPSCGAAILIERRPTRPDEERGWTVRHLASIMGRAGASVMIVQNAAVLAGLAVLASAIAATLGEGSTPDLRSGAGIILLAELLDLIGLGLIGVALVALGAGSLLLHRTDPETGEEVRIPTTTASLPIVAGVLVFAWTGLTAIWRLWLPSTIGANAAGILAEFGASGEVLAPTGLVGTMMGLWVLAAAALLGGAALFRLFVMRLPAKVVPPRPIRPSAWIWFAIGNLALTILVAIFPLGWVPFRGMEGVFLGALGAKLTVVPVLGVFAYITLLSRFEAFGRLSILVPVLRAVPREAVREEYVPVAETLARPVAPPADDEMAGIDRIK